MVEHSGVLAPKEHKETPALNSLSEERICGHSTQDKSLTAR